MMGGALGGIEAMFLPAKAPGSGRSSAWAPSSAAPCARPSPVSIFALELTHDVNMLVPLLLAVTIAHGFTVLTLRRSILTEKVARRGYHLSREYAVDPLEILFVREVDATEHRRASGTVPRAPIWRNRYTAPTSAAGRSLYPVVDSDKRLIGVLTRHQIQQISG